jgi:hypothetical protein
MKGVTLKSKPTQQQEQMSDSQLWLGTSLIPYLEAEAGGCTVQGQFESCSETLSQKTKRRKCLVNSVAVRRGGWKGEAPQDVDQQVPP